MFIFQLTIRCFSALSMLRPWKGCFASATMSAFLAMNIIPKLEKALQEMIYDPTKNHVRFVLVCISQISSFY